MVANRARIWPPSLVVVVIWNMPSLSYLPSRTVPSPRREYVRRNVGCGNVPCAVGGGRKFSVSQTRVCALNPRAVTVNTVPGPPTLMFTHSTGRVLSARLQRGPVLALSWPELTGPGAATAAGAAALADADAPLPCTGAVAPETPELVSVAPRTTPDATSTAPAIDQPTQAGGRTRRRQERKPGQEFSGGASRLALSGSAGTDGAVSSVSPTWPGWYCPIRARAGPGK